MNMVIQRVVRASVSVGGETRARIGPGLLLLVAIEKGDDAAAVEAAAEKVVHLRCFAADPGQDDAAGTRAGMDRSVLDTGGEILAVSQFTLAGSIRKGRRPSFDAAAPPEQAEPLFGALVAALRRRGARVATGVFRAMMQVELTNDGPVTFVWGSGAER
jgi:D-tyrosyl-tRNA(Tyr) deacylase